jgi:hypothetical protein
MFWSYFNDANGELLGAIDRALKGPSPSGAKSK